jgi:hypothetical protein
VNAVPMPAALANDEPRAPRDASTERELFYYLIHSDVYPESLPSAWNLINARLAEVRNRLDEHMRYEGAALESLIGSMSLKPGLTPLNQAQGAELIRQIAPQQLLEACWLQSISQVATSHLDIHAALFGIYRGLIGDTASGARAAESYRALMTQMGVALPEIYTWPFAQHRSLLETAIEPAVLRLCLAQFPQRLLAEILGFTLAHCHCRATAFTWLAASPADEQVILQKYLKPYERRLSAQREPLKQVIEQYLGQIVNDEARHAEWQRIRAGFRLYDAAEAGFLSALRVRLAHTPDARAKVAGLLQRVAPYAGSFHQEIQLGGKTLDAWFNAKPFDVARFLDEFAASPYVNAGDPERSAFFRALQFGGPMYGVFDAEEHAVLRDWLSSLGDRHRACRYPEDHSSCPDAEDRTMTRSMERIAQAHAVSEPPKGTPQHGSRNRPRANEPTSREAFYRLINSDGFATTRDAARRRVVRCLRKARSGLPFRWRKHHAWFPYHPLRFDAWLNELYRRESDACRPFKPPPRLTKEEYRWSIRQLAPAVLVDGCWLQNCFRVDAGQDQVSERLLRIYADEVGNGNPLRNHANVYRRLLESLDIYLPAVGSREFASHPEFLDAAFDLPVYLMAISLFPREFRPEILGLNLAIELSGLGAGYRRLADELDYWGIDSSIVRLHQSIDNYATGHAALAKEAVILHLDKVLQGGEEEMQRHWQRVWTGYRSLAVSVRNFQVAWALAYVRKFLLRKMRQSLWHTARARAK